ncbi:MAG TPA: DUF4249 domain-containing protein [Hanamia sp.]|nr:DUF4249 domain-containing protein [Hanamia sp.]
MKLITSIACLFLLGFLATSCKTEYYPKVQSPSSGYLVVEGFINGSDSPTAITLSRTLKIYNDSVVDNREHNAMINIEGENNESFPLYETGDGVYTSSSLQLSSNEKYRLKIKTANGKEYVSNYSEYRSTPAIDSLSWIRNNDGVKIYINTHSDQNEVGYYYWKYEETWEYHAPFYSSLVFIVDKDTHVVIGVRYKYKDHHADSANHVCWKDIVSSNIITGSSKMLSSDHIYFPVMSIPAADQKLGVLYSIIVKQYSISEEAYSYLQKLKKNTEEIGSIFAAQPTEITGNIHCTTNPSERVIGFVEVSQEKEKRIFISNKEVPGWNYDDGCRQYLIHNNPDELKNKTGGLFPTVPFDATPVSINSFYATPDNNCIDCSFNGSNIKPSFWP